MFKQIIFPILAVAGFIVIVGLFTQGKISIPVNNTSLKTPDTRKSISINNTRIYVEVARTDLEKQKGLSNRESLAENSGMIFVFNQGSRPSFWMKDTLVPLDIIWIRSGRIVGIDKNVRPETGKPDSQLKKYPAPQGIDYVLEVNAGFSDKNNITTDQMIYGLEQL